MNEDEAARAFSRAAESIPPIPRPPASALIERGQRRQRRQRLVGAAGVGAAAALLVGAAAVWVPGSSGSAGPPAAGRSTAAPENSALPPAPEGTRWVGLNGAMVAVPDDWSVNDTSCGGPDSDTVDFRESGYRDCLNPDSRAHSWLRVHALSSPAGRSAPDAEGETVLVDGIEATRVGSLCDLSDPSSCFGQLTVPDLDVVFRLNSPVSNEEVNAVLDTARLVPEGFTAVPDVTGLQTPGAGRILTNLGLVAAGLPECDPNSSCAVQYVDATDPLPGSVVPTGTTVTSVASAPPGQQLPTSDEEVLEIYAAVLREHFRPPSGSDAAPVVQVVTRTYEVVGWTSPGSDSIPAGAITPWMQQSLTAQLADRAVLRWVEPEQSVAHTGGERCDVAMQADLEVTLKSLQQRDDGIVVGVSSITDAPCFEGSFVHYLVQGGGQGWTVAGQVAPSGVT